MGPRQPFETQAEALERARRQERQAVARHSAHDETDPPPALDIRTEPQAISRRSFRPPKITAKGVKEFFEIVAVVGAIIGNGVIWLQNRASKQDVADGEKRAVDTAAAAIASALAPIPPRIRALEKRAALDGQRWDALDRWHAGVPAFNRPNTTKPEKFGPHAQQHGETSFAREDDDGRDDRP